MNETDSSSENRVELFLRRKDQAFALGLVGFGLLLRLSSLGHWWLNPDEGIYYAVLSAPDSDEFWGGVAGRPHPPLYWMILRFLGTLTPDFFWYRILSQIGGAIAIYAGFLAGRELAGPGARGSITGLIAAGLIAISPGAIVLSQVARPYILLVACLLLAVFFLTRYLNTRRPRSLVGYAIALSAALLLHYSSFLGIATIGIVLVGHVIARQFTSREVGHLVAAHAIPLLIVCALYYFHLRVRLINSDVATTSLSGWLAPYMVGSPAEAISRLFEFLTLLVGPRVAIPGIVVLFLGVGWSGRRRSGMVAGLTLAALLCAYVGAASGKYPFGCTRHASWAIAFLLPVIAWTLGMAVTSRGRVVSASLVLVATLVLTGEQVCRALDTSHTTIQPQVVEQCLSRDDFARLMSTIDQSDEREPLLLNAQSYYTLIPLFRADGARIARAPGQCFHFRWRERDVVVLLSWSLAVRARDVGTKDHLFSLVQTIDRELPQLGLENESRVLMIVGSWSNGTLDQLVEAHKQQTSQRPLISNWNAVPGLYAFHFDLAAYMTWVKEALKKRES